MAKFYPQIKLPEGVEHCRTCGGNGRVQQANDWRGSNWIGDNTRSCPHCAGMGYENQDEYIDALVRRTGEDAV